jgi:hypothetical protein
MNGIALRTLSVFAFAACVLIAPAAHAAKATPKPGFFVDVYAQGEHVTAVVTAHDRSITLPVRLGETEEFDFPVGVTKYTFEIIGCGRHQTKTLMVPVGHPGAKITVYKGCALVISGR